MQEMRERSGVPLRRLQVVPHLICGAGLVRRRLRGYSRAEHEATEQDFEHLVAGFEERGRTDEERLRKMMRYAQATDCRKQILREYFGEPRGEPGGACDNCLHPQMAEGSPDGEVKIAPTDPATAFRTGILV